MGRHRGRLRLFVLKNHDEERPPRYVWLIDKDNCMASPLGKAFFHGAEEEVLERSLSIISREVMRSLLERAPWREDITDMRQPYHWLETDGVRSLEELEEVYGCNIK